MNCKDCKHWLVNKYNPELPLSDWNGGGICNSGNLTEHNYDNPYEENNLVYEYYEGGKFWTGAMFGCVNFKEKK